MIREFEQWLYGFSDEKQEEIIEKCNPDYSIESVEMGFASEEDVAYGYFGDDYPITAYLCEVEGFYILFSDENYIESTVYNNKEMVLEALEKLRGRLYDSIEKQIERFTEELGEYSDRVEVEPKREYSNSGYFYSFNIELDGGLLVDGTFGLCAEDMKQDIENYDMLKSNLEKDYGISVEGIKKVRSGFERYYEIELEKDGNYTEVVIHICGTTQGRTKKIVDFIDELDIEEILEELSDD